MSKARFGGKANRAPSTGQLKATIDATDQNLARITSIAWKALVKANRPRPFLFRFGGRPAWIENDDLGAPIVRGVDHDRLKHRLARTIIWFKPGKRGHGAERVPAQPPSHVVRDMLATPNMPLPVLKRIVATPILTPKGTLRKAPGYDTGTQTYYQPPPGFVLPRVPSKPTAAELCRAKLILEELLGDFPFVSEADRTHAAVALMEPFARSVINGPTPLYLIAKPSPGSGASLLADVLAYPFLGRPIPTMSEAREEEEWRKRITAKLRSGPGAILLDNLQRRLDSPALSAAITSTTWEDRLLGSSETLSLPVEVLWLATGNNPSLSHEMTRRAVTGAALWSSSRRLRGEEYQRIWRATRAGEKSGRDGHPPTSKLRAVPQPRQAAWGCSGTQKSKCGS